MSRSQARKKTGTVGAGRTKSKSELQVAEDSCYF